MQVMLERAFVALWPKLEPLLASALCNVVRKGLLALKAQTLPADSPFKFLESVGDEAIDAVIAALPA